MPGQAGGFPTTGAVGASGIGVQAGISTIGNVPPHVPNHQAGGIDPLNLALIAGNLTNAQHGPGLDPDLHHAQVHGHSVHTDRVRLIQIPIQSFTAVQGAPAITQYGAFPNTYVGWAFDPAADEAISTILTGVPYDFAAGTAVGLAIYWTRNVAGVGWIRWHVNALAVSPWDSLVAGGSDAWSGQNVPVIDCLSPTLIATAEIPALAGNALRITIQREGTHIADDFPSDIILVGVGLRYTADM